MRYKKIDTKIWNDEKFEKLSPTAKLIFFYLLTCPHSNMAGIFKLKEYYACGDTGLSIEEYRKGIEELQKSEMIEFDSESQIVSYVKEIGNEHLTGAIEKKSDVVVPKRERKQKEKNEIVGAQLVDETEVVQIQWNEFAKKEGLPQIQGLTEARKASIRKRLKDLERRGMNFKDYLEKIKQQPFLLGQNAKKWKIVFDWILRPTNFQKIIEGSYIDSQNTNWGMVFSEESECEKMSF